MDRYFENWLKEDSLYDFYVNADEETKKQLYKDYQYECIFGGSEGDREERVREFLLWMSKDPEQAEIEFPDFMNAYQERLDKRPTPFLIPNLIRDFPGRFGIRKENVDKLNFKSEKNKKINQYILLITNWLNTEYTELKIQSAVDSIKDSLVEELEYWRGQYDSLTSNNNTAPVDNLSVTEICIRHFLLANANLEPRLTSKELAEKNTHKSFDNIRKTLPIIEKKWRDKEILGNKQQLMNVKKSLNDFPDLQDEIEKMISMIN